MIHHTRDLWMKGSGLVDYLFNGCIWGAKPKAREDSADVHIRRDVYREVIRERDFEVSRKDICRHAGDLRANTIELKESVYNLCA